MFSKRCMMDGIEGRIRICILSCLLDDIQT